MNYQEIIVGLLFLIALLYIGRKVYYSLAKKGCQKSCGGCSTIDFSKIQPNK